MSWLEVIQVRAFDSQSFARALASARELSGNDGADPAPGAISLWTNPGFPTDLCIQLHWEEEGEDPAGSWLGLQLAREFSRFGWTIHSFWKNEKLSQKRGACNEPK